MRQLQIPSNPDLSRARLRNLYLARAQRTHLCLQPHLLLRKEDSPLPWQELRQRNRR